MYSKTSLLLCAASLLLLSACTGPQPQDTAQPPAPVKTLNDAKQLQNDINFSQYNTGITLEMMERKPDKYKGEKTVLDGTVFKNDYLQEESLNILLVCVTASIRGNQPVYRNAYFKCAPNVPNLNQIKEGSRVELACEFDSLSDGRYAPKSEPVFIIKNIKIKE